MHPNPYTQEVIDEEESFNNPAYHINWSDYTREENYRQLCIEVDELNERIEELENKLATPWYVKLWNRIPKFSLSIRRTN